MFAFPRFQTPRVNLRLLTLDDAEAVFRHFADPGVTEFADNEPLESLFREMDLARIEESILMPRSSRTCMAAMADRSG